MNDTLDELFEDSGDEEESQDIVNQVLDEIGIEITGKVRTARARASRTAEIENGVGALLKEQSVSGFFFNMRTRGLFFFFIHL